MRFNRQIATSDFTIIERTMRFLKYIGVFGLLFMLAVPSQGQMRGGGKKLKKVTCPIVEGGKRNYSLGVRVGDPYGITGKVYLKNRWGVEVILGRTFAALHNVANKEAFDKLGNLSYDTTTYLGHEVKHSYVLAIRAAKHFNIGGYTGLDWYAAAGVQGRYYQAHYVFQFSEDALTNVTSYDETIISAGPEVAIGIEFVIPYQPLGIFAEVGAFSDVLNGDLVPKFLGGLGFRYNFR